ncbi:MAG TPA: hypothetical protein VI258_03720 [Rhodanobacteraceae bacterium]
MRTIVARRHAAQLESFRSIEDPDHEEMREAVDVLQPLFELRQDLEDAFRDMFRPETFWHLLRVGVVASNESDGARREHRRAS